MFTPMSRFEASWLATLLLSSCALSHAAEPADAGVLSRAIVTAESAWVFSSGDAGDLRVGLVARGAVLEVTGCEAGKRRTRLGGGLEIDCSVLRSAGEGELDSSDPSLRWGKVRDSGTRVRAQPRADAKVIEVVKPPYTVALIADDMLQQSGWLRRRQGGYVRIDEVWLERPSEFRGEKLPQLPLAFAVKDTRFAVPPGLEGLSEPVARRSRVFVLEVDAQRVLTEKGTLPRSAVRLAFARPRPGEVPEDAKWVHVDLNEQVLTAYEGDRAVYATLVSTGTDAPRHHTHSGLYQVWLKSRHDRMHGEGYFVEEVPFILFFRGGEGLHGTFWHDAFGRTASHGCVNLSMADAKWLFEWAPPELPEGWHTVYPARLSAKTLFVQIERASSPPPSLTPDGLVPSTNKSAGNR